MAGENLSLYIDLSYEVAIWLVGRHDREGAPEAPSLSLFYRSQLGK